MELLQLQYFQTVAKFEHMTKAAESLHIAQPALSKTIARLELDLGVPLFDRQGRQIRLNAYGKAFLNRVNGALSLLEEGKQELADLAGAESGSIRLATNSLGRLSGSLGAFRERYPNVNFRIKQIAPSRMEEMARLLQEGEIDLAFTAAPLEQPNLRDLPVVNAAVYLAVPSGHKFAGRGSIRLREAADEPFVEYQVGHPFRKVNDSFYREAGFEPNIVCEVEEPASLGNLVQAGLGVAFVPACKPDEMTGLSLVPIAEPVCSRTYSLVWHERRYLTKAAQAFRGYLVEYFG